MVDWIGPALKVKLLSPHAKAPTRSSSRAAGYDLYASEDLSIAGNFRMLVPTDISLAIPAGHYGRIAPRSGLALNHGIDVGAGVVDEDYRGHVQVLLINTRATNFSVRRGDRIAQLILERIATPPLVIVDELDETVRGEAGFGSTGR